MNEQEIAFKYVHGHHDAFTDNQEKIDMAKDILDFAKKYHKEQLKLLEVNRSKPKDTNYRSGIVNLEFIKEDREGIHYKATPIEEDLNTLKAK